MKKHKILIADDHTVVRIGLAALLGTQPDMTVVGEADNGAAAVAEALRLQPDIVIMDLMMPKKDGAEATRELTDKAPGIKIIILTSYTTSDGIFHALQAGAAGAIVKTSDDEALLTAIRKVAEGGIYISPTIRQMMKESPPVPNLTERQVKILESVARGLSNTDIANQFGISSAVAREHVTTIFQKLGAANRAEAVAIALRKHLLKI